MRRPGLSSQRFGDRRLRVSEAGAPEFQQVVSGCDQLPLGLAGGEAAPEEAEPSCPRAPTGAGINASTTSSTCARSAVSLSIRSRSRLLTPRRQHLNTLGSS